LTRAGQSAKDAVDNVLNYPREQEEKQAQEQEERRKRFDELTKGH
jgi:hypothetical protein